MTEAVFNQIRDGLLEALDVVEGKSEPFALHVADSVDVKAIRSHAGLSQKEFAAVYGFGLDQLKQWEQGRASPVKPLRAYLTLIAQDPAGVRSALEQSARAVSRQSRHENRKAG